MLADAHRQAAEDIERGIMALQATPNQGRLLVEAAWGASFHYIAHGCQVKHGQHHESHAHLGSYLNSLGEPDAAQWWAQIDRLRQGGWNGHPPDAASVQAALDILGEVRVWATN